MRELLSNQDILKMRQELDIDNSKPHIPPPKERELWNVNRILTTLEYFMDIEIKYNELLKLTEGE